MFSNGYEYSYPKLTTFGDEENISQIASRFLRFFVHTQKNDFVLFVECGLDRVIKAVPSE